MQNQLATGLFHIRPIRTRAARFEISCSLSRSNNGFICSQIQISAAQDRPSSPPTYPCGLLSRCCTFNASLHC